MYQGFFHSGKEYDEIPEKEYDENVMKKGDIDSGVEKRIMELHAGG